MVRDGICGESAGEKMAVAVSNSKYSGTPLKGIRLLGNARLYDIY